MKHLFLSSWIYFFIFATGSAGLIYQVAWQKYLQRLLGSDNIATAIILGVFLGGLSLGYYLCGRLTTRVQNHFRAYSILEIAIGAWCLLFPVLFDQLEGLTAGWSFQYPWLIVIQGLIASFLLMGLPTVCMGATIPFLTKALTSRLQEATTVNSLVYAINTAGAFLGVILAGFYLIPTHGLPMTIMGAALINIAAAGFFYVLAKYRSNFAILQKQGSEADNEFSPLGESSPPAETAPIPLVALYATAFLSGFYVMTLQNVLIRLSALSFGSSSYAFSLVVAVFIFCIALGSFVVSRLRNINASYLFFNQFVIALSLTAIYLTLDSWPYFAHVIRVAFQANIVGFWAYQTALFVVVFLVLFVPLILMGATLPLIFHHVRRDMERLGIHAGYIFSCNTFGALLGSLIGGLFFFWLFDIPRVFLLAVSLAALSAILLARTLGRAHLIGAGVTLAVILILTIGIPFYEKSNFRLGTFRFTHLSELSLAGPTRFYQEFTRTRLIYYRDGIAASVAVIEDARQDRRGIKGRAIIINGKSDSHTIGDVYTLRLLTHLPLLLASSIDNVLIIGLGTGMTAGEATLYPEIKRIDIAEMSREVVAAQEHFRDFNRNLMQDKRVNIHLGDALRIMTRSEHKWDVIISQPSNPWTAGVDQLFTKEFYQQARAKMTERGIFLQWLHIYSANHQMLGLVFNTMMQVFPHIRVFFGNAQDLLILASDHPLDETNVNRAEAVFAANREVRESLREINIHYLDWLLLREMLVDADIRDRYRGHGFQTRDFPVLHYLAGQLFFLGSFVPFDSLLNADTALHRDDYLLSKKYATIGGTPFTPAKIEKMLAQRSPDIPAAVTRSLRLKRWLAEGSPASISEREASELGTGLISLIMRYPLPEEIRRREGLILGYRSDISRLVAHEQRTRNWIAYYPLDGLRGLINECIARSADAEEQNWCRLQKSRLMLRAGEEPSQIDKILEGLTKDDKGRILLQPQDEALFKALKLHMAKDKREQRP